MNTVKIFPGDTVIINGARVQADRTVTLVADVPMERESNSNLTDLPETNLRMRDLWSGGGHRVHLEVQPTLRCPCGSVYTTLSETHLSCYECKRVWRKEDLPSEVLGTV